MSLADESSIKVDENNLERIGDGSRRCCFRMPGQPLCVKFYRTPAEYTGKTRPSVRASIFFSRFCLWFNVNYHEASYHERLRKRLPRDLFAVFPERMHMVFSRKRGWGVVESLIENADGSAIRRVVAEMRGTDDHALRRRLYRAAAELFDQLAEQAVCFYDPPNVMVQWTGPEEFSLRIVDFEPMGRALIPGLSLIPAYVRYKVRRRCSRYLKRIRESYLPDDSKEV
ncbi:MAG: YrbL family protein [Kiritimatiellae bacterium]|nr:YrbL family protein [Kiritimatiellia bacterium]MDD3544128.1 YrbL family protein [Kiritimatiellia bacterium]MDD4024526.1 YrbL family protein [Kiritimatiellia bacterium]MDD4622981.1 YrbL family protein [Kiritimatiellia bacterium]